jgi:type IV secretion system protein TrbL
MPLDSGVLTTLLNSFVGDFSGGYARIYPDAMHLLSLLATLEVTIAALWWGFSEENAIGEIVKKIMKIGFFIFVVANYQTLIGAILDGFVFVGLKAGGRSIASATDLSLIKDPSAIVRYGLQITGPIFAHNANYDVVTAAKNLADILLTNLSALLIILAFFALAIQVFITYLEFFLVAVLGLILVPFGAFKHTAFIAEKVFGAIISFGIRLMVLAFILATVQPTLARLTPPPDPSLPQVLLLLLTALTVAGLSWHAPAVASGLISGSPSLTAGTVMGTGLALATGAVGAGVAASAAAGAGLSMTKAAAGAVNRAGAAFFGSGEGPSGGTSAGVALGSPGGGGEGPGAPVAPPSSGNPPATDSSGTRSSAPALEASPGGKSPVIPNWAYKMSLAQRALPEDAHPGPGQSVPLGRDS